MPPNLLGGLYSSHCCPSWRSREYLNWARNYSVRVLGDQNLEYCGILADIPTLLASMVGSEPSFAVLS